MIRELDPLTLPESKRLIELESVIQRGIGSFVEVGNALAAVRDEFKGKFPSIGYANFEEYCELKWKMSKAYAWRVTESALIAQTLPMGNVTSERQIRPLTRLATPEAQSQAWSKAHELAKSDGKESPTARHVEQAVREIQAPIVEVKGNTPEPMAPSDGIRIAEKAINILRLIDKNDEQRKRAGNHIIRCSSRS